MSEPDRGYRMEDGSIKWYESALVDSQVVISARVRFARNFDRYPFPTRLSDDGAKQMSRETVEAVMNSGGFWVQGLRYFDVTDNPTETLLYLMEHHSISNQMVVKPGVKGLVINGQETVSIMINEEDHVRIQSIYPGDNLDKAYETADAIDTVIDEKCVNRYAFDHEYGYLSACPTNTGTGLRASLMLHLPALEYSGYINKLLPALGKFGMTVRGIHGEGSESLGSVYQLSNQITLGKTEPEIILSLQSAAMQVITQEINAREKLMGENRLQFEDKLYRSYGILKHCRSLDLKEGMRLLSDVRLGFVSGVYEMKPPRKTIYNLMMEIQPGNIIMRSQNQSAQNKGQDQRRAEIIRDNLN